MAIPDNIRDFNWAAVFVLRRLYEKFPYPIQWGQERELRDLISEIYDAAESGEDLQEKSFMYLDMIPHVLTWMRDEGFIRGDDMAGHPNPVALRLTARGLHCVERTLKKRFFGMLSPAESFQDYALRALREHDDATLKAMMSKVASTAAKMAGIPG